MDADELKQKNTVVKSVFICVHPWLNLLLQTEVFGLTMINRVPCAASQRGTGSANRQWPAFASLFAAFFFLQGLQKRGHLSLAFVTEITRVLDGLSLQFDRTVQLSLIVQKVGQRVHNHAVLRSLR
jgi:hypothetical protein